MLSPCASAGDASGGGGAGRRRAVVAVRAAEAAQVGHDDVGAVAQQRRDLALVRARARPAVQEDDRRAGAGAVVLEAEPVDGPTARHAQPTLPARAPYDSARSTLRVS